MDEKETTVVEAAPAVEQPVVTTPEAPTSGGAAEVSARQAPESKPIDPATFGLSEELLASLDEPDPEIEPDPDPAATPTETQQVATEAAPEAQEETPPNQPEQSAAAPAVIDESDLPAIPTGEGYPSIDIEPGKDPWGNLIHNGKAYVSVSNPDGGPPQLFEADPTTGLIALDQGELDEMRANNPDGYLAYTREAEARRSRLGEVLTASSAREEATVKRVIVGSGISEETFAVLDTEARKFLKPMGGQAKAPGMYSQAFELAIGKAFTQKSDGKIANEIVRAYLAVQSGQEQAQPAQPAQVATPAQSQAAPPAQRTSTVRLPAGVAHAAAPPVAAQPSTATTSIDPELATLLAKSDLSIDDYKTYGGSLVVN